MSFDGSFTHSMTKELKSELQNGRVTKINEPYLNEIILTVRSNSKNYQVLLSANPSYARVQTTKVPFVNPQVPSNFVMTLRKHIQGSFITKIHQVDNDRIIHFHFNSRNELGDIEELVVVVEIMARHSNIILVEAKNSNIIDAVKRIGPDKSRYRTLLPGSKYINPPKQDNVDPFSDVDFTKIESLERQFPNVEVLATELRKHLQGLGKDTSLALADALHETGISTEDKFRGFFAKFNEAQPTIATDNYDKLVFSAFPFTNENIVSQFDTLSGMLDEYFQAKVKRERVREQGAQLIQVTKNELKKNRNKLRKLERSFAETKHSDEYRIKGEVLMTYLHEVKPGDKSVELANFYDNNNPIKISLKPALSPSANAQWYFKQYQKKKNSIKYLNEQIAKTNEEISYFENIESQIEIANPEDLVDIKTELKAGGYIRDHSKSKKRTRIKVSKPEKFISSDGTVILVGKNNLQNDQLTLKTADKRDIWLHAQKIHGSHVIIRSFDPSEETIIEAAELAAYFSKARDSANVPVDYDPVKRVKKPNGAKPGLVHYTGQKTVYVTPSREIVEKLRQNK
ncbi:Rqc2 family fibronectin-binding protein [Fructilactobacillus sp. Tb1]|uniref:Rqc2 family fibronectin-binding protein n=1 Tax=Fructilactobacillus sp. Tb1 TaxID=3422304 RepID=UPI003D2966BB